MTDITNTAGNEQIDALYRSIVIDSAGEKVGSVGQVYLDDVTGNPTWITVNTGFLGLKESFVPLERAQHAGEEVRVPYLKEFIKSAPAIDPDGHIDEAQETELYRYYDLATADAARSNAPLATDVERDRDLDRDALDRAALTGDTPITTDTDRDRDGALDRGVDIERDAHLGDDTVLREERLVADTETVEAGRARLRKHVVTEKQTIEVPVTREELVVERTPLEGGERVVDDGPLQEGTEEIVLHEERPVISKETVATEKVNIGTREVTETKQVAAEVGKETVEVVHDVKGDTDALRETEAGALADPDLRR